MEAALERLLDAVQGVIADLDALDGDPDLEQQCEDEGAVTGDDEPWLNPPTGSGSFDFHDLEMGVVYIAADEDQRRVPVGHIGSDIVYREVR